MLQFPKINGSCRENTGFFPLPDTLCCSLGEFEEYCLSAFSERLHLAPGEGKPWLILQKNTSLPREGYQLAIKTDGILLQASSEQGVIHGLTTVYLRCDGGKVGCCEIADRPVYSHRGQSFDCVRHFFSADEVKKVLEQMALVKMNVLHFHLTDDQGWRIESKVFPALHQTGKEYYTQVQLKEIVEFARTRGIEVIPEIDLPGHTTAILAAYPELGCTGLRPSLATEGGIYSTILCAGQEQVYLFLEQLLSEICPIFPSPRFHIGGDEAPKTQWKACPHCKAKLQKLGSDDFEDLQSHFTCRVSQILARHGKTPLCWNETLKGRLLPADLQIQYWTVDGYDPMRSYIRGGGKYIYSSMYELYLDYPYSMTGVKKLYKLTPKIGNLRGSPENGMLGLESTFWSEHIHTPQKLQQQLFPRLYIVAEKAWSGCHEDYSTFLAQLDALCALARKGGITPMEKSGWNPKGKQRQKEAFAFFAKMNGGVLDDTVPENTEKVNPDLRAMYTYVTKFFRITDLPKLAKLYFK